MSSVVTRTVLAGAGTLLGLIGGALMVIPIEFLEMSHVFVERDPSLMSELMAPSGVLLITSVLMILGAARTEYTSFGLSAGAIIYGSYGIGRLISLVLHGVPSNSLIAAMIIELFVAVLLVALRLTPASAPQKTPAIAQVH